MIYGSINLESFQKIKKIFKTVAENQNYENWAESVTKTLYTPF